MSGHTIVVESAPIHWEAVLVTAVPAFLSMVAAIGAALIGRRNHEKIKSIDNAVNGTAPGEATLRETVEAMNSAVNDTEGGIPSISENVRTLVDRRDLDPETEENKK